MGDEKKTDDLDEVAGGVPVDLSGEGIDGFIFGQGELDDAAGGAKPYEGATDPLEGADGGMTPRRTEG